METRCEPTIRIIRTLIYVLYLHSYEGNPFPSKLSHARTIAFGDTFLLVGGLLLDQGQVSLRNLVNTIYRYEADADTWTLLSERLRIPRSNPVAFHVGGMPLPTCPDIQCRTRGGSAALYKGSKYRMIQLKDCLGVAFMCYKKNLH